MLITGFLFSLTITIITIQCAYSIKQPKTRALGIHNKHEKQLYFGKNFDPNQKTNSDFDPQAVCDRCALLETGVYCICNNGEFDIVEQISNMSRTLDQTNPSHPKEFFGFTLYDGIISEFPENSFLDMKFENIVLENTINLQRIHTNAFNSTALYTSDRFMVWGDSGKNFSLRNEPPQYDFWAAISSLVNVRSLEITLAHNMEHEIPANAFRQINGPQINLVEIDFIRGGYTISRIGEYAFSALPNLTDGTIDMSYVPIEHISPHAFDFNYASDRIVNVYLTYCELTEDSFDAGSFIGRNRPIWLHLSHNNIRYIRREVFYDFFDGDHRSLVFFDNNPLNCNDTAPFEWLLLSPIRNEYMARIVYPYCENGTEIWHLNVGDPGDGSAAQKLFYLKISLITNIICFLVFAVIYKAM